MEQRRAFGRNGGSNSLNSGKSRVLLDLNINQKHKTLRSYAYELGFKQYGLFSLMIVPKENQSLEESEQLLLLRDRKRVKNGDFPKRLVISAIINDMKLQKSRNLKLHDGLATALYKFISMTELGKRTFGN